MKKLILWLLAIPLVLIGGCYVANLILYPNTGPQNIRVSKETTYLLGPVNKDGFVDYVQAINERESQGVTPENNAYVLLLKAIGPKDIGSQDRAEVFQRLGMESLPDEGNYFVELRSFMLDHTELKPNDEESLKGPRFSEEILDEQEEETRRRPWAREEFPAIAAWLETIDEPLNLALQASRRSRCYWPSVKNDPQGSVLNVGLGPSQTPRYISMAIVSRAMLALNEGRPDAAWEDLIAVHRLSRLTGNGNIYLVIILTSYALSGIADQGIAAFAEHATIDRENSKRMIADLRQLSPLPSVKTTLDSGERFCTLDATIEIARTGNTPAGNNVRLGRFSAVDWNVVLEYLNEMTDEAVAAANEPTVERQQDAFKRIVERIENETIEKRSVSGMTKNLVSVHHRSLNFGTLIASLFLPASATTVVAETRTKMQFELSILAIALSAYKHDHAEYPDALAKLVPDYLDEIPLDLFTNKELRYEKAADGYLLYSLGPNMKDDGGATADDDSTDYDIVVRVPSNRGQNGK